MNKNNQKSLRIIITISVIMIFMMIFSLGCAKKEEKEIKIGVVLPLTGEYAKLSESVKNSIQLALESNEPFKNFTVKIIFEDSQGQTNMAVNATNKLVTVDKVSVIIGELSSSATLAIKPITEKQKVVLISPAASSPKLSESGHYFFRTCASDIKEGEVMAKYVSNSKIHRVAILYINNDYGLGLKNSFSQQYRELGGNILAEESFEEGSSDFRSQLTKIKTLKVEAIYMPGYAKEMGLILRQAKEFGIKVQFFSSIDFENSKVKEIAGGTADGVIYTAYGYDPSSNGERIKSFIEKYKKKFNSVPDIYAALAYDAINVVFHSIKEGNFESESIMTSLHDMKGFTGVTGEISFDKNGDVTKGVVLKSLSNGQYKFM